jgi:hypothetical protein
MKLLRSDVFSALEREQISHKLADKAKTVTFILKSHSFETSMNSRIWSGICKINVNCFSA